MDSMPATMNSTPPPAGSTAVTTRKASSSQDGTDANSSSATSEPYETAEVMLRAYILDYLVKTGLNSAATALRAEITALGQIVTSPPPIQRTPHPFLYDWFSLFWDKYVHRVRREMTGATKAEATVVNTKPTPPAMAMQGDTNSVRSPRKPNQAIIANSRQQQQSTRPRQETLSQPEGVAQMDSGGIRQHQHTGHMHRQPPRFPSSSNFQQMQSNQMMGVTASVPPNPVSMGANYGMTPMTMFQNQNEMLKRSSTPGSHAGFNHQQQQMHQGDHISVRSAPPNFGHNVPNAAMLHTMRASGMTMDQMRQGNTNDVRGNDAMMNGAHGSRALGQTGTPFDVQNANNARSGNPALSIGAKFEQAVHSANLHTTDRVVAGANAAAVVAASQGRALPAHAIPVRVTRENGLIYLDGSSFKVWPGGHPLPQPRDPKQAEELMRAAEQAKVSAKRKEDNAAQMTYNQSSFEGGRDIARMDNGSTLRRSNSMNNSESRPRKSSSPDTMSPRESSSQRVSDGRGVTPPRGMPISVHGPTGSEPQVMGPPATRKVTSGGVDIDSSSMVKGNRNFRENDDSISIRSAKQDSVGMSQRSSGSGESTLKRTNSKTKGKGRTRTRKKKESTTSPKTGAVTKTGARRGRKPGSKNKKKVGENGRDSEPMVSGNLDMLGQEERQSSLSKSRMPGSEGLENNFGENAHLFGMLGQVNEGPSGTGTDGGGLDDTLHGIPEGTRGLVNGLPYDADFNSYLGPDDGDFNILPGLGSEYRGGLMDQGKLL